MRGSATRPASGGASGFAITGAAEPPAWNRAPRSYDLDDAKGILELLAARLDLGSPAYAAETGEAVFHPGRTARASIAGRLEALVGELHPAHRRGVGAPDRRRGDRRRGRHRRARGGPSRARSARRPSHAIPRWSATSRSSCRSRRSPPTSNRLIRARGGELLRDLPPVRHLPGRAARGGREEPRVPAPVRRARTDARRRPRSRPPSPRSSPRCPRSGAACAPERARLIARTGRVGAPDARIGRPNPLRRRIARCYPSAQSGPDAARSTATRACVNIADSLS